MPEQPPPRLVELVEQLGLATAAQVRAMDRRARRLAKGLPLFESVWVDALAQARVLTPFQAAEINAGRGQSLRVGPYILRRTLRSLGFAACHDARRVPLLACPAVHQTAAPVSADTAGQASSGTRLAVIDAPADRAAGMLDRLERLVVASKSKALPRECLAPVEHVGVEADRIWAACGRVEGLSAAEWMIHNGRFPPEAVLEIARQMLPGLVALEEAAAAHGDVRPESLLLADDGRVVLLQPGLRAAVRPEESYANADLPPEAYDCLAPERITEGTPPSPLGDVYACGCLWWHMLTGRPAVAGGTALAKLRTAQTVAIPDVRPLAPDTPEPLAAAVSLCTRRNPSERPESLARLATMLGPSTRSGRTSVLRCRGKPARRLDEWTAPAVPARVFRPRPWWLAAIAGCLVAAAAVAWSISQGGLPIPTATIPAERKTRLAADGTSAQAAGADVPSAAKHVDASADVPSAAKQETHSAKALPSEPGRVEPLVLGSGGPVAGESLELRPGQCVRGEPGRRPLLTVPRGGLVVRVENVRFENIDFVWDHASADVSATAGAALIHLQASRAEFHGCTFRSATPSAPFPSAPFPPAVRWTHPVDRHDAALALPSGRVRLGNCVFRHVGAGVDCHCVGAVAVELTNTLHLGAGPLVRLDHPPGPDEPIVIGLAQVTLRHGGPLLECPGGQLDTPPGKITIQAIRCALVPGPKTPLLRFTGEHSPEPLLANVRWTGQGSLVGPQTPIAQWRRSDGHGELLDDAFVSIAGLVRSEVEFAGNIAEGPAASQLTRWQAPLHSTAPPGIDPTRLPNRR